MTKSEYRKLIREYFDPVLAPHGFSTDSSKRPFYWRKLSDEIYHVIAPDALSGNTRYDISVFGTSPYIQMEFSDRFPDDLSIINDRYGYLSPEIGVGDHQKLYFSGNPRAFETSFNRDVKPALIKYAIPYLDKIQTLDDLIPTIAYPSMRGKALFHAGRFDEARPIIESEIRRLTSMKPMEGVDIKGSIAFYQDMLDKIDAPTIH